MMTSYTLPNWDGIFGKSEEEPPQTPSNSRTGEPLVVTPNLQYDSTYGGYSGNGNESTIYRHGHGVGTEAQHIIHDASSQEESTNESKACEPLENSYNNNVSTIDNIIARKGEGRHDDANRNGFHRHRGDNASNQASSSITQSDAQRRTSKSSAYEVPTKTKHRDTGRNHTKYLNTTSLSPLSSIASLSSDRSLPMQQRLFVPDLTSPLHAFHPSLVAKRKLQGEADPYDPPPKRTIAASRSKSPQTDITSVYTADAEGEDDDMMAIEVLVDPLSRESSVNVGSPGTNEYDSLFTPPPSSDECIAAENLFTPPPTGNKQTRPAKGVLRMSHVEVPPLKRPRSDYKPMLQISKPKKPKNRPQPKAAPVVNDLARALQASYDHNESLGSFPSRPKTIQRKRKIEPKPSTESSQFRTESIVASGTSAVRKGPNDTVEVAGRVNPIPANRMRIADVIDLASVDCSKQQEKAIPRAKPPTHRANHDAQSNAFRIYIGTITPIPPDVAVHNTQFLRQYVRNTYRLDMQSKGDRNVPPSKERNFSRRALVQTDSLGATTSDGQEEFSPGGLLVYSEEFGAVSEDIHNHPLIVPLKKKPVPVKPRAAPYRPPPKIDLVAHVKSRKRKSQIFLNNKPPPANIPPSYGPMDNYTSTSFYVPASLPHDTISVTPNLSSSSSISNNNHPQPQTPTYIFINKSETATAPSLKALGKRKAVTPPLISDSAPITQDTLPRYLHAPQTVYTPQLQRSNGNLDIFLHHYTPSEPLQPSLATSSSTTLYDLSKTGLSPLYSSTISTGVEPFLGNFGEDLHQSKVFNPWKEYTNDSLSTYEYNTVDPTLLGGEPINVDPLEDNFDMELEVTMGTQPTLLNDAFETISSCSSSPHRLPSVVVDQRKHSFTPIYSPGTIASEDPLMSPTASNFEVFSRRRRPPRKLSDMVDTTKVVPLSDDTASESRPSPSPSSYSDGSESDVIVVARKRTAATRAKISRTLNLTFLTASAELEKDPWPICKHENTRYCHQCRRKHKYLLMLCACSKVFCSSCLARRYPERDFDLTTEQSTCPGCEGYCNCTICCGKRGVRYVKQIKGSINIKSTMRPASKRTAPVVPGEDIPYWGTVYNLDGQKLCTTYAPPTLNGLPSVVFAEEVQPRPAPPKRVFSGKLQRSWGFGRHPKVTDVNPVSLLKAVKKSRDRVPRIRWFTGSPAFLRYRLKPTVFDVPDDEPDDDDLLAGLSPLTWLDSDSDEANNPPTEGTELIRFSPLQHRGN